MLHVIERYKRVDPNTLDFLATIADESANPATAPAIRK
jgi:hypothetical protein